VPSFYRGRAHSTDTRVEILVLGRQAFAEEGKGDVRSRAGDGFDSHPDVNPQLRSPPRSGMLEVAVGAPEPICARFGIIPTRGLTTRSSETAHGRKIVVVAGAEALPAVSLAMTSMVFSPG
jgi:hypothetical protein